MSTALWAIAGGIIALVWIKGTASSAVMQWRPVAFGTKLLPEQLDTYAYLAAQKQGTMVKFVLTQGGASNATCIGSVQHVYVQNNVRKWSVRLEKVLAYAGQNPPTPGEMFTLTDDNLIP